MSIRSWQVALASSLVLLTGCGQAPSTTVATPVKAAPVAPMTAAQAKIVAAAGVLTGEDMPGYKFTKDKPDKDAKAQEALLESCMKRKFGPYLAENPGFNFRKGQSFVMSSAEVNASAANARAGLTAVASPQGHKCFISLLKNMDKKDPDIKLRDIKIGEKPLAIPGADLCKRLVPTMVMVGSAGSVKISLDEMMCVVGQAEISLTLSLGAGTLTEADARVLLIGLAARTRAAQNSAALKG